jgi:HK97 gp10 family phage protein
MKSDLVVTDELSLKLARLGDAAETIGKKAIYEAAGMTADKIRESANKVLSGKSTGDMMGSLGITPIDIDDDGILNAKIGFSDYDRKGVPNPLKARALESGTSTIKKRPFVRPAIKAIKQQAEEKMEQIIKTEINKTMK